MIGNTKLPRKFATLSLVLVASLQALGQNAVSISGD